MRATRLLTLTGAGGCGKTRLALRVATDIAENFVDGVWWVDLASLSDPALVPQSVALVLGLPEVPNQALIETLSNFLKPKDVLLILDNCEHLRAACAELTESLLVVAPGLQILATSREPLGTAGEMSWLVPSMSMPDLESALLEGIDSPSALLEYDALHLFVERAAAVSPTFRVKDENARAIMQVCQRLDGMPLAIELAATRARVLTVEQILARLDDRFALLTAGNRTAVIPRHQTLRAAIDWSYNLLSETQQVLLCRLAVFAGGFTLEAAEAVCSGDGLEQQRILDLLTELVDKSMVVAQTAGRTEARYRMLETIREYASEKLSESGDAERTRDHHLDFILKMAEDAQPTAFGPTAAK